MVELIIVMVLLSITMGIITPKMINTDTMRLDYEARLLALRLNYVKQLSKNSDEFTAEGYRDYEPLPHVRLADDHKGYGYYTRKRAGEKWSLPDDMQIGCNLMEIVFYKNGEATNCTLVLSLHNKEQRVIVDRVGRIRIAK